MGFPTITPRTLITKLAEYIEELIPFLGGTSGGTVMYGGTDAGDDLELHSTSHATKGDINLGDTLYVDEVNNRVGINKAAPTVALFAQGISGEVVAVINNIGAMQFRLSDNTNTYAFRVSSATLEIRDITNSKIFQSMKSTEIVINESGDDRDFRIEGDTEANLLFVDAGNENVGIRTGTPNAAAALDVTSTTKGFLPPRMTTTQRNAISSPPSGLVIYNTTTKKLDFYNGTVWGAV